MKNDNEDKAEGVADVDDDDNYDNINKKILLLKSIQQGIRVRVFVGEVLIKRLSHSSE